MISSLMKYGAVVAKVRGMYGKLLSENDWRRLCGMKDTASVYSFLRSHPGYERTLEVVQAAEDSEAIIDALRQVGRRDFERVFSYAEGADKELMLFAVRRFELMEILAAIRRITAGEFNSRGAQRDFFQEKSVVNIAALRECNNLESVLSAIAGSIYEEALRAAPIDAETGAPDYMRASIQLENTYYTSIYSFLGKKYTSPSHSCLLAGVGLEADIVNISAIFRLRRYFPASFPGAEELLIPVGHRLKPELRRALIEAPSEESMLAILQSSRLGKYFERFGGRPMEYMFEKAIEDFSAKTLRTEAASICAPQAYLSLRDIEINRLIRVIKAIDYGREPARFL